VGDVLRTVLVALDYNVQRSPHFLDFLFEFLLFKHLLRLLGVLDAPINMIVQLSVSAVGAEKMATDGTLCVVVAYLLGRLGRSVTHAFQLISH